MEMKEYQRLAMRTDDPQKYNSGLNRLINALMGLNGEAGEAIDLLKKALFQGHELEKDKLIEELGDNLWYLAEAADTIGVTLEDIANANLLKLLKRYPDGFKEEDSINRDGNTESEEQAEQGEVANDQDGEPFVPPVRNEP